MSFALPVLAFGVAGRLHEVLIGRPWLSVSEGTFVLALLFLSSFIL